jgi:3-keto-5-aminohexanoate cleavage enzyme
VSLRNQIPIAIAVAPNGGRRPKADHPKLPTTVEEIARVAAESLAAGAAMIHAHIRDAAGGHLLDAETYRRLIAAIQREVGDRLVIQITSESIGKYQPAEQIEVIKAVRPEAVSLAVRELAPDATHEAGFADFLRWLRQENVVPQIILYTPDEVRRFLDLEQRGLIPWPKVPVLFVLGHYTSSRISAPADLTPFLPPAMPAFPHWMVCAFGRNEQACLLAAAGRGGHARVGFENNLSRPDGSVAESNATQVADLAQRLREAGHRLQTAAELRAAWAARA